MTMNSGIQLNRVVSHQSQKGQNMMNQSTEFKRTNSLMVTKPVPVVGGQN